MTNKMAPNLNKTETTAVIALMLVCLAKISYSSMTYPTSAVCGFTEPYQTADLEKAKSWSLNYTDNSSLCVGSTNETTSCNFVFAFCQAFNCSNTDKSLMNASACLTLNNKNVSYKLGSYNESVNPFEVSKSGGAKFVVHFQNGSSFKAKDGTNCSLLMDMTFNCKQSGLWQSQGQRQSKVNKTLLTSIRYNAHLCKYYLEFDYDGACPFIHPAQPIITDGSLSTGSVLVIIFVVSMSIYCILGGTIKCLQGNRGKEIIPNSNFWVMLPVYIADGFLFTCEKVCCCSPNASNTRYDTI